ncbi:MAG: aminoacetone oxidase family FAD-binding enzyme [Clostridia bacterium]
MRNYNVIIIGGGASGMAAAMQLKDCGVAIIEANSRLGKKLLSTGNGKCNLLNFNVDVTKYNDKTFVMPTLEYFSVKDIVLFFKELGLEVISDAEGRAYPRSEMASSVLDVLRQSISESEVDVFCDLCVKKITQNGLFKISTDHGDFSAKNIIFATGSVAGSGFDSLNLISGFVKVKPFFPSLAPLRTDNFFIKGLSGVRVKCTANLVVLGKIKATEVGEVLFKDFGLSGISIFNLSGVYSRLQNRSDAFISLNLLSMSFDETRNLLLERLKCLGCVSLERFFVGLFHKILAKNIVEMAGLFIDDKMSNNLIDRLAKAITEFDIKVLGLGDLSLAQVCTGGVELEDVNPNTLEAKKVKGLYFTGEVLDIDGLSGGYNLLWAWASAAKVAQSIKKSIN